MRCGSGAMGVDGFRLRMSLLDTRNYAEISCPDYPVSRDSIVFPVNAPKKTVSLTCLAVCFELIGTPIPRGLACSH